MLTFISLKNSLQNAIRLWICYAEVLLPSAPVSQYTCMKLPKTDDNGRTHKNDANALS